MQCKAFELCSSDTSGHFQAMSKLCCAQFRQQVYAGSLTAAQARKALHRLSSNGPGSAAPSTITRELQDLDEASQEAEIEELSKQFKGEAPLQQSVITCMTSIQKAYDEVSHLPCKAAIIDVNWKCTNLLAG